MAVAVAAYCLLVVVGAGESKSRGEVLHGLAQCVELLEHGIERGRAVDVQNVLQVVLS